MKTCASCKYFGGQSVSPRCNQPIIVEKDRDPVTGESKPYCSVHRLNSGFFLTTCGKAARYWEPKEAS